ncbi:MAG: electron transport complex subunit E [Pseudomonadales bacterium]|nr:electron transport complex subunit E [Pseudomonadales bacterium]MCP5213671.1 electron transport complex subunit E [Pseudomonadales bacterium]
MADNSYREIASNGLWHNNPVLVQGLGLCPLLAVSGSVVNALGLGLATMAVLTGSNVAISMARKYIPEAIRLPIFVIIIACFTTCIELIMNAFTFELYEILGLFIPLIVTNCVILGRADVCASRVGVLPAAFDGLMMGLGFTMVLVVLGAIRELFGTGALFSNMQLLLWPETANWTLRLVDNYNGFLLAILPPGAFLATGLLVAGKNIITRRLEKRNVIRTESYE